MTTVGDLYPANSRPCFFFCRRGQVRHVTLSRGRVTQDVPTKYPWCVRGKRVLSHAPISFSCDQAVLAPTQELACTPSYHDKERQSATKIWAEPGSPPSYWLVHALCIVILLGYFLRLFPPPFCDFHGTHLWHQLVYIYSYSNVMLKFQCSSPTSTYHT